MAKDMECKSGGFVAFVIIFCMLILAIGLIMTKLEDIEKKINEIAISLNSKE